MSALTAWMLATARPGSAVEVTRANGETFYLSLDEYREIPVRLLRNTRIRAIPARPDSERIPS